MWKDSLSLTRQQAGSLCQSIDVQLNQREALEGLHNLDQSELKEHLDQIH